jgi:catechol 2,3-dioxygenase-like lactoylglutathione lyase family enzyme
MPRLERVIETAIYVDDLARAAAFYEDVMELPLLMSDNHRFRAYDIGGECVFLVFHRGETLQEVHFPGGTIPPHDGHGPLHMAFGVATEELPKWEQRLNEKGVAIEARATWPRGGHSLYFRDPDQNLLELVTRGIWPIY